MAKKDDALTPDVLMLRDDAGYEFSPEDVDLRPLVRGAHQNEPEFVARRHRKMRDFLRAYGEAGTIAVACRMVNVDRNTVYSWMEKDPEFAKSMESARDHQTDLLEAECRRRAREGFAEAVYYQGRIVGHNQKYSDLCLLALLNAYRPEKFKNRTEHTGRDGGPIAVVHVSYDHNMKPDDME